jgi:hypothetical protein
MAQEVNNQQPFITLTFHCMQEVKSKHYTINHSMHVFNLTHLIIHASSIFNAHKNIAINHNKIQCA